MNLYAIHEKQTLAALHATLALHEHRQDDLRIVLKAIRQHPAAIIASAVDDCRGEPCPYCCAEPWEGWPA